MNAESKRTEKQEEASRPGCLVGDNVRELFVSVALALASLALGVGVNLLANWVSVRTSEHLVKIVASVVTLLVATALALLYRSRRSKKSAKGDRNGGQ